jgi:transposase
MSEDIRMSNKEANRIPVLEQVKIGSLSLVRASDYLGLSYRQTRRIWKRYTSCGVIGILHGNRNTKPPNKLACGIKEKILELFHNKYNLCNDTHFTELLSEREGIEVSRESVRELLRSNGISAKRKRKPPRHRRRRERKEAMGQMVLWDGSPHRWFGENHHPVCLMTVIDDATSTILAALFVEAEGSVAYLQLLDMLIRSHGIPLAIYHDRHTSLVRSDNNFSHEELLIGRQYPTHIGRVLEELGIRGIPANSPQAKGRVERSFGTLQDRLIAEMSIAGINNIESANKWLKEVFIERYNKRFAVAPEIPVKAFKRISRKEIEHTIAFAYEASVGNDNCIRLGGLQIDIPKGKGNLARGYAKERVLVRQHLNGSWSVWSQENMCIAKHEPTPFREPIRSWKKRNIMAKGQGRRETKTIEQVYINSKPAPHTTGHFTFADMRTF